MSPKAASLTSDRFKQKRAETLLTVTTFVTVGLQAMREEFWDTQVSTPASTFIHGSVMMGQGRAISSWSTQCLQVSMSEHQQCCRVCPEPVTCKATSMFRSK